jgi:hypothetical protein
MKRAILIFCIFLIPVVIIMFAFPSIFFPGRTLTPNQILINQTNYTRADPNLIHLSVDSNGVGTEGSTMKYPIEGIPVNEYICIKSRIGIFNSYRAYISKESGLKEEPILDWEYKSVVLYNLNLEYSSSPSQSGRTLPSGASILNYGQQIFGGTFATIDVQMFKDYVIRSIETKNYVDSLPSARSEYFQIRVFFTKYENLVWDAKIVRVREDNSRYIVFYLPTENEEYKKVYIPLPAEIVALIPQ